MATLDLTALINLETNDDTLICMGLGGVWAIPIDGGWRDMVSEVRAWEVPERII